MHTTFNVAALRFVVVFVRWCRPRAHTCLALTWTSGDAAAADSACNICSSLPAPSTLLEAGSDGGLVLLLGGAPAASFSVTERGANDGSVDS